MIRAGIVFRRTGAPRTEPFYTQVIAGLETSLAQPAAALLVRNVEDLTDELATYQHWHATEAVEGVVIKDVETDDPRIDFLSALGLPFVLLGDVSQAGSFSAVRFDNGQAMDAAVTFLQTRGHHSVARVTGPSRLLHMVVRSRVFDRACTAAKMNHHAVAGDFSTDSGYAATRTLITGRRRPSAIIYDNDLMALGGLAAAHAAGVDVPGELSILAWDDSADCQLADPAVSALSHDITRIGEQLGRVLVTTLEQSRAVEEIAEQPMIVERGTTAAPGPDRSAATDLTSSAEKDIHR